MKREKQVLESARDFVNKGSKPSAAAISQELSWPEQDVHRCLNILERKREVETYRKEALGKKMRMVSVYR